MGGDYGRFKISTPVCTWHTAITPVLKTYIFERQSLMSIPIAYSSNSTHSFQYSNHLVTAVCSVRTRNPETTVAAILKIHMSIVYSLIGEIEPVDEPTELVGLAGVTEVVGLAGSPPTEDGCVQILSSMTEDKLSEVSNDVNISYRFLVLSLIHI